MKQRFGPCFARRETALPRSRIFGSRNSSCRCTNRGRSVQPLSPRYTAIINTSTQPRTKILAGVRGALHQRVYPFRTCAPRPLDALSSRAALSRYGQCRPSPFLFSPPPPRPSFVSVARMRAMCTNALILSLSFSLCSSPSVGSRCIEVWILVGLAGASIAVSLSADNIGVDRSSCSCRSHCLVLELFINVAYDSIVRK